MWYLFVFVGDDLPLVQRQHTVGVGAGIAPAAGAGVEQKHLAALLGHRDMGVAEQGHLGPAGGGGIGERIQIVFTPYIWPWV